MLLLLQLLQLLLLLPLLLISHGPWEWPWCSRRLLFLFGMYGPWEFSLPWLPLFVLCLLPLL